MEGKFPLETYNDKYEYAKKTHKFQNTTTQVIYDLKVIGFNTNCRDGEFGVCEIDFEDTSVSSGGRRLSKKHPTARRRSSSKARKSRKARKARSTRRR